MTSRYVIGDPSALQAHVDEITGAPPVVRGGVSLAGPYGGPVLTSPDQPKSRRGTTNGNRRGGSEDLIEQGPISQEDARTFYGDAP